MDKQLYFYREWGHIPDRFWYQMNDDLTVEEKYQQQHNKIYEKLLQDADDDKEIIIPHINATIKVK